MGSASKEELRRQTTSMLFERLIQIGFSRSVSSVFAVIGFWSQFDGGVVKDGKLWRWREYAQIAQETGYSKPTIQRAVRDLREGGAIWVRRMYNPLKSGETVNGFRLTRSAYVTLGLDAPADAEDGVQPSGVTEPEV